MAGSTACSSRTPSPPGASEMSVEPFKAGPIDWKQLSVLITGGTGSFGNKLVEIMLRDHQPRRLVVFSRDELKQSEMRS